MVNSADLMALAVTLRLASVSTLILLVIGIPIGWWLSQTRCRIKPAIEALVAIPLVLPPTVLGFYLLIALGPTGSVGRLLTVIGGRPLAFTFAGLVVGSVIYSLPFVVQPIQNGFAAIGRRPFEVAATLGASPVDRFLTIGLPMARSSIVTAAVLGFAHTVGEFGVVLMIGGSIPGETQVLSIAIYDHVEALEYGRAHLLAAALLLFSFALLLAVFILNRRSGLLRS